METRLCTTGKIQNEKGGIFKLRIGQDEPTTRLRNGHILALRSLKDQLLILPRTVPARASWRVRRRSATLKIAFLLILDALALSTGSTVIKRSSL